MALRLRRDVQKASYYVWFLGAEEAKGLRGPNVINPVIPYLIERSQKQEPLKVTLQVSHKGIKILQESSKHFIPHSAITSSIQRDDIVACVLLLYNPATKCPIHVHAYRCDSETTAEALHQQLQILINRPDNQKRFAELESRLGLTQSTVHNTLSSSLPFSKQKRIPGRFENRFISTLSSDTGISTRESEGSEEHLTSISPKSPVPKPKGDLFDSLAAELRAKLNGNGPPLLLPPRDYDTVHRSKGNLAAIELRRCQNSMIVGATTAPPATTTPTKQQVSSRGSSGIGSDLAPSPERQDDRTSSDDDNWSNEADNSIDALKTSQIRHTLVKRYCDDINDDHRKDNYLRDLPSSKTNRSKYNNDHHHMMDWGKEDDIRPKLVRPTHKNWGDVDGNLNGNNYRNRKVRNDSEQKIIDSYPENYEINQNKKDNHHQFGRKKFSQKHQQQQHQSHHHELYDEDYELEKELAMEHKQNLTDRQKYQKTATTYNKQTNKQTEIIHGPRKHSEMKNSSENQPVEIVRPPKPIRHHYYPPSPERERPRSADRYRGNVVFEEDPYPDGYERNPYKEPESLPYRESIEKMLRSPIMRYKSFENDEGGYKPDGIDENIVNKMELRRSHLYRSDENNYHDDNGGIGIENRSPYIPMQRKYPVGSAPSPVITEPIHDNGSALKVSFKERFQEAKEKFRAMEKSKYIEQQPHQPQKLIPSSSSSSSQNYHHGSTSTEYIIENDRRCDNSNWSDDERQPSTSLPQQSSSHHGINNRVSRTPSKNFRRSESKRKDDLLHLQPTPIMNSKSLSNLVKGYRHSYAEPLPALPRSSGRVGLAAVNPF